MVEQGAASTETRMTGVFVMVNYLPGTGGSGGLVILFENLFPGN